MIRVVVVDDETLVRSGLRMLLQAAGDIAVVGEARDGEEALDCVGRHRPDVVLMDVRMPGVDGLTAAGRIAGLADPPKVIMLTTFDRDEYVHEALRHGAVGFLLKDTPPRDLAAAVRTVAAGNAMLAPSVTRRLIATFSERGPGRRDVARAGLARLTDREHQVVLRIATGETNLEIAQSLGMSEATVKAHVSRALTKLGLHNRVQAAILVHEADVGRRSTNS
jgi:DNA-binding NarL/FixJ family response regulator